MRIAKTNSKRTNLRRLKMQLSRKRWTRLGDSMKSKNTSPRGQKLLSALSRLSRGRRERKRRKKRLKSARRERSARLPKGENAKRRRQSAEGSKK